MWVYGFSDSNDVNVDEAMRDVRKYFVTGVFLKPER